MTHPAALDFSAWPQLGAVTLLVRDLPRLTAFYVEVLGLAVLRQNREEAALGVGEAEWLRLQSRPDLPAPEPRRPGLFHAALLLPDRAALGSWVRHASALGVRLGAGDHLVSEALYLTDPEGNGVEVYRDRPREEWSWAGGQVRMDTLPLDLPGLLAVGEAAGPFRGAAPGTRLGHVHLRVGDAARAARFYAQALDLHPVAEWRGAAFLSWGGYHHHFGLNEWETRGAGRPLAPATGLGEVEILVPDLAPARARLAALGVPAAEEAGALAFADPWGLRLSLRASPAAGG
ncbi:glyoxalase [Deinococcus sp. RL]|uniref:VOC family protein n=1 Tax=Deinococcus sp. RL TaxID=1489678 RepID=UPI0004D9A903|nr:VOC family protein [Deinococcus sp. RL]KEF35641.1 glyoxalase [Deinococcus sp. RL]